MLREHAESDHLRGIQEIWSRDAGFYYCNELYYRSLSQIRALDLAGSEGPPGAPNSAGADGRPRVTPVLFVHLPPPSAVPVIEMAGMIRDVAFALLHCS